MQRNTEDFYAVKLKVPPSFQSLLHILIYSFVVTLYNCTHKPQENVVSTETEESAAETLSLTAPVTTGSIQPSVNSTIDPALSYAIYLPKAYTTNNCPAIVFFDPHGDGALPVAKYVHLAEKYNTILIGSNNSKNGMSFDASTDIARILVAEVQHTYHANAKAITLAGFSGGAKVAMLAASINPSVSRVVYCGAVHAWQGVDHKLELLGIAGTYDMNYADLALFNTSPDIQSLPHYLIEWDGKHEWPDEKTFEWAFQKKLDDIPENIQLNIDGTKSKSLLQEQAARQQLIEAFSSKDIVWWQMQIADLHTRKNTGPVYARLLGYISLACYSLGNQALQQGNLPAVQKILSIYSLADPGNKDCEEMRRAYYAKGGA